MGRATRKAGEQTQQRILEVALPLFAEHGFSGTSTRKVATAADVNVATLAYYFGDKEGLYVAVLNRMYQDMSERAPEALAMRDTPGETIDAVIDVAYAFVVEHRVHIRLLLRHVLDSGAHEDTVVTRWSEPLMQKAAAVIAMFRPDWTETHRRMLVLTVTHSLVRLIVEDERQLEIMLDGASPDEAIPSWFKALVKRELGITE